MKKIFTLVAFIGLTVALTTTGAWGLSLSFSSEDPDISGSLGTLFTFSDGGGNANFQDKLSLGVAKIDDTDPEDAFFNGDETIAFADFFLDESSFVSGQWYDFAPTTYTDGFRVYDDSGTTLLAQADVVLSKLNVYGATGVINPYLQLNLSNIEIVDYTGGSVVFDDFLNADAWGFTVTLQYSKVPVPIESSKAFEGTYSGTVIPAPEPGTVLLLGAGVLGVAAVARKRAKR